MMVRTGIEIDELVIDQGLVDAIVRHCARALPNEGCGLLSGRQIDAALVGGRFFPGTNVLASPSRFAMDPAEVVAALTAIDRDGDRLAAIVHSHPSTGAAPSRTDVLEAYYPEALLLIVPLADVAPRLRAWRAEPGDGQAEGGLEVPIRVGPPP